MDFTEVAIECVRNTELVREFNRLTDCKLGIDTRLPIEKMIDEATGYSEVMKQDMGKFIMFVFEFIWLPLTEEVEG